MKFADQSISSKRMRVSFARFHSQIADPQKLADLSAPFARGHLIRVELVWPCEAESDDSLLSHSRKSLSSRAKTLFKSQNT